MGQRGAGSVSWRSDPEGLFLVHLRSATMVDESSLYPDYSDLSLIAKRFWRKKGLGFKL